MHTPPNPLSTLHAPPLHAPRPHGLLRRQLHPRTTPPPETDHAPRNTLDFHSSDETLDRYQEVISAAGWHLENYRKNPVVQNAHSYWSLSDTIGKALITEIRGDASPSTLHAPTPYLFQRIQFAVEENPLAKIAYGLYRGGFLNAVSVGFIPIRWEDFGAESSSSSSSIRRRYLEQELLEVSAVSIPANPNALIAGLKAGAIERGELEELLGVLRDGCGKAAAKAGAGEAAGERAAWDRLQRQVNELRAILQKG